MRRLILPAAALVLVSSVASRTRHLMPDDPAPYVPYDSELFLMSVNTDTVSPVMSYLDLSSLAERAHAAGIKTAYPDAALPFMVDTVAPRYISFTISETDGDITRPKSSESELRSELVVALPRTGRQTTGVMTYTTHPDGMEDSEIYFYDMGDIEPFRTQYDKIQTFYRTMMKSGVYAEEPTDSVILRSLEIARAKGIVDSITPDASDMSSILEGRSPARPAKVSKYFKEPAVVDFFNIPKGDEGKKVKTLIAAIPFPMVSYSISPEDFSITARLSYDPIVTVEEAAALRKYIKSPLVYEWDGKRYRQRKD